MQKVISSLKKCLKNLLPGHASPKKFTEKKEIYIICKSNAIKQDHMQVFPDVNCQWYS